MNTIPVSDSVRNLLLSLLCILLPAFAEQNSQPSVKELVSDYSQEATVLELSSTKMTFENDGTFSRVDTARIRVQSQAGVQRVGVLTFSYESAIGTLDIEYVRVKKPNGKVVDTPPENIQDMAAAVTREAPFYSDLREKHIAVKGLGIGDVLEFETVSRVTKPLIPGQFWLEFSFATNVIVLEEKLEVSVPGGRAIKLKNASLIPSFSEANGRRTYTWVTANLKRKSDTEEKRSLDKAAWEQARGQSPGPDVFLSSFQSWQEVGNWYEKLQQDQIKPTPEVRSKAAELTKDAKDDDAKLRAIYQYVSTQFHYIGIAFGIGRYQPHFASEVLDNRYGDCKDKHTLFASLLNAAGIKSYPGLISSAREIDADVPSPGQFDHVITFVPRPGGPLWLDTTTEVGPFAYLLTPLRDKHALVVRDDKPAALESTPIEPPFPSTQHFRIDAKLSDAGALEGNAEFSVRGDIEVLLRSAFRATPVSNWKDLVQRISQSVGFGGDVSEVSASSPEKLDEPFRFSYKYTRKDFGDWPNHRIVAPLPFISLPTLNDEQSLPSVPIWLGAPGDSTFHSEIELPPSYSPELPSAIHEKSDFAVYEAKYSVKDHLFVADRQFTSLVQELPANEFDKYKAFRQVVQDDYSSFITLSSSTGATSGPNVATTGKEVFKSIQADVENLPGSSNDEANRLLEESVNEEQQKDTQAAISSLYRAVGADPKFIRGWVGLAKLLMNTRQSAAAEDALQKAIAADPSRIVAHKMLGMTLLSESKFEQAIPVWKDVIRLAPADITGYIGLASCQFRLKKYSDDAATLELAIKIGPKDQDLQWQLAVAYLKAVEISKAMERFHHILDERPDAMTLNEIAYKLATSDVELPAALQYAEKAVHTEEETSQKIKLTQLRADDLLTMRSLAADWDTLGFIEFEMSNAERAEKYLNIGWLLSLKGTIADHLCQLYERDHKPQTAIHMCQLALERLPLARGPSMDEITSEISEVHARLEKIRPGSSRTDLSSQVDDINRLRTFKLPKLLAGPATADFFILLAQDSKTHAFKVQETKFVSGNEKLRPFGKSLFAIDPKWLAPDDVPTHLVRRGTLGCFPYGGCSFVLLDVDSTSMQ